MFHIPLRWSGGFGVSCVYSDIAPLEQRALLDFCHAETGTVFVAEAAFVADLD